MNHQDWIVNLVEPAGAASVRKGGAAVAGIVHGSERVAVFHPADQAPPEARQVAGRLVRDGDGWWIDLPAHGRIGPVAFVRAEDCLTRCPFAESHVATLRRSRVLLIGCGSVGGLLGPCLGRCGVGHIAAADPDRIEMANLGRHVAGPADLGRFKAAVVADRLRRQPGAIDCETITTDIYDWPDERRRAFLGGFDLILATTDRMAIQMRTAHEAWRLGAPALFAGCFEAAQGGEVFVNLPGTDAPCYACLRGAAGARPPRGPIDYSDARNADEFAAEPGMAGAVWQVAAVAAQVAIAVLLRGHDDSELAGLIAPTRNYLLIGTAQAKGYFRFAEPFETFFQPLSGKRRDCHTCGDQA